MASALLTAKGTTSAPSAIGSKKSQMLLKTSVPTKPAANTSFFSAAGQSQAVKRVVDVFTGNYDTVKVAGRETGTTGANVLKAVTIASAVGSGAYLATSAAGLLPAGTAAKAMLTAPAALGGAAVAGLVGGALLSGGGKATTAPQTVQQTPQQIPQQTQQVSPQINPSVNPYIGGSDTNTAGRDIITRRAQVTQTYTYPTISPSAEQTPQQTTGATQSQEATTGGTNWGLIAAVAVGAYLISR